MAIDACLEPRCGILEDVIENDFLWRNVLHFNESAAMPLSTRLLVVFVDCSLRSPSNTFWLYSRWWLYGSIELLQVNSELHGCL